MRTPFVGTAVLLVMAACASTPARRPLQGSLEAAYRIDARTRATPSQAAVRVYRSAGAGHGSRCRMAPSDSRAFELRAARCGAAWAAIVGVARLFTEVAADTTTHAPVVWQGRLRWFDVPDEGSCWP